MDFKLTPRSVLSYKYDWFVLKNFNVATASYVITDNKIFILLVITVRWAATDVIYPQNIIIVNLNQRCSRDVLIFICDFQSILGLIAHGSCKSNFI